VKPGAKKRGKLGQKKKKNTCQKQPKSSTMPVLPFPRGGERTTKPRGAEEKGKKGEMEGGKGGSVRPVLSSGTLKRWERGGPNGTNGCTAGKKGSTQGENGSALISFGGKTTRLKTR